MFVRIEKIAGNGTEFFEGYMWDTPSDTLSAFRQAKEKFAVPFETASYLVDLYEDENEMMDTFPISELNYRLMVEAAKK